MFGISGEHLIILGIVLLILGPRRLPELGNTLGKAIRNFKDAIAGVEEAKYRRINSDIAKSADGTQLTSTQPTQPEPAPTQGTK